MLQRTWRRIVYWLRRDQREQLLAQEMESHLDMMVEDLQAKGMSEAEARLAARRQFGNVTRQQESARETWISRRTTELAQDLRFAVRHLRRQPGVAVAAVASAGLGIGACSLIFTIANAALFRPLPVAEPDRLAGITGRNLRSGKVGQSISYPDFQELGRAGAFESVTAFTLFVPAVVGEAGNAQRYWGSLVADNYFDVLRPRFAAGGASTPSAPAVVISHRLWRSRFAADPSIVGATVLINRRQMLVAGVAGPGFHGTEAMFSADFWAPLSLADAFASPAVQKQMHDRGSQWLTLAARLREGASFSSAQAESTATAQRLAQDFPATNRDRTFHVERAGQLNPGMRKLAFGLFALLAAVAVLILLIACANIANLLLARAAARYREINTRLALGAGRGRLVRQMLTESVLLAACGGVAGLAVASVAARALSSARLPLPVPISLSLSLDYRVVGFCAAISTLAGIVFGLAPALRATRQNLTAGLKNAPAAIGGPGRWTLRNLLTAGQVAVCMVVLISSGLFLRSFIRAYRTDTGLAHRNLLLAGLGPNQDNHRGADVRRRYREVLAAADATPGVLSSTLTSTVPLSLDGIQNTLTTEDISGEPVRADIYLVAPRFFETFGIPLLAGADFTGGADAAILNRALAAKAFPGRDPVGRTVLYQGRRIAVIGVVANAKSRSIGEEGRPCLYLPIQAEPNAGENIGMTLVLRTGGDPRAHFAAAREAVRRADPGLAVHTLRTLDAHISDALLLPRLCAFLFGLAGAVALLIAVVGLYGVMSFATARRTREIGIRMALGARPAQVLIGVMREGAVLTAVGGAVGLAVALAFSRVTASLLYGVNPRDALTFAAVPLFLSLVALAACWAPARRAAAIDPMVTLREE